MGPERPELPACGSSRTTSRRASTTTGAEWGRDGTPTSTPIVHTSLFTFPDFQALVDGLAAERRVHVYTRGQTPP
ncbi:MAG: hypothetical protein ACRELC_01210 [Gemmatimonadota bacterium]